MDAIQCLMTRRSIRKYQDKSVDKDLIRVLLEAGANAPSAGNQQPWEFIVITDKQVMQAMSEVHPYGKMVAGAAAVIAVCCRTINLRYPMYRLHDCSAAAQNILLAANALGIGAVWCAVHDSGDDRETSIKRLLNMPEDVNIHSIIPCGWPDETKESQVRLTDTIIHYERWCGPAEAGSHG